MSGNSEEAQPTRLPTRADVEAWDFASETLIAFFSGPASNPDNAVGIETARVSDDQKVKRARAYLAKVPAAISGSGGHNQTWDAALKMVRGFDLSEGDAFALLWNDYNPRCDEKWSEKDLWHKVKGAAKDGRRPRGYLLANDKPKPPASSSKWNELADLETANTEWRDKLQTNDRGVLRSNEHNIIMVLRNDPAVADMLGFDLLVHRRVMLRAAPYKRSGDRFWRDTDVISLTAWIQEQHGIQASPHTVASAVDLVAWENQFHPVRDYLNGLKWDGTPRLGRWLGHVFGVEENKYTSAVGRAWLISAVDRAMHPGCKADYMLVLEGGQGIRKTTALKELVGSDDWYAGGMSAFGSKDSKHEVGAKWIIECAELDKFTHAEVGAVKAFMSETVDNYRPAYGREVVNQPRQCVLAGTINPNATGYLKDETGNRRFWPVVCRQDGDLAWIAANRDQLWAEATHALRSGEKGYLSKDIEALAAIEQDARRPRDSWEEPIGNWLALRPDAEITTTEILSKVLELPVGKHDRASQMRVASVLRDLGWSKNRATINGVRDYFFRKI